MVQRLSTKSRSGDTQVTSTRSGLLFRLLWDARKYWHRFLLALVCGLIKFSLPFVIAYLVGDVVDILNALAAGTLSPADAWHQIQNMSILAGVCVGLGPIPTYFRSVLATDAVQEMLGALRLRLYGHVQSQSHTFFDSNRSGALVSRIIGDVENLKPFLAKILVQTWLSLITLFAVFVYLMAQSWRLGLLAVCLIPVQGWLQLHLGGKLRAKEYLARGQLAKLSGDLQEKLAAATLVKAYTQESLELSMFQLESEKLVQLNVDAARLSGKSEALTHLTLQASQVLLFTVGAWLVVKGIDGITPGLVVKFILMQGQLHNPILWLNETQLLTASALGSLEKIFDILDTPPDIVDRPGAKALLATEGDIRLEDVSFAYPGTHAVVLEGLALHIPARTTLALVGPSGGGKSTIIQLLNRFYEWHQGAIRIDGHELRDLTLKSLRASIGLVSQEPILFSGTIEDNIRYGRIDASLADVKEAAQRAFAEEFILRLPEGYQTVIGERGTRLSGGQKQRLSIARAFLKNPRIIILDEATSALDAVSERIVQAAMDELMRDRTAIVIAHRFSTIRSAHRIAVIEGGRLRELGTWQELIAQNQVFARLWREQFEPSARAEVASPGLQ